jgi:CRP-like cAMP-binding protein
MIDQNKLAEFAIFKDFDAGDLGAILAGGQKLNYETSAVVVKEDEAGPDSDLYIILDGRVEVLLESKVVQSGVPVQKQVAILQQGEIFGGIGLLGSRRRSAQIRAYGMLSVLKVSRATLFDQIAQKPQLGFLFMRNLASILSDRLVDLNFMWRDEI